MMDLNIPYNDIVDNRIVEVRSLRYSIFKTFVSMVLSLFVLGIPFVFAAFKPKLLVFFCYFKAPPESMTHVYIAFSDGFEEIADVNKDSGKIHNKTWFVVRNARYFLNKPEEEELIEQAKFPIFKKTYGEVVNSFKGGLTTTKEYESMAELYGKNTLLLSVEQKITKIVAKEFRNPFMVQLVFSLIFSAVCMVMTFFALILGSLCFYFGYLIYNARVKFRKVEKAFMDDLPKVKVLRNRKETEISAAETVVGDYVNLTFSENQPIFFDCLVTKGHAVVSEASLTGESNPIYKGPPKNLKAKVTKEGLEQSMVLAGSVLFDARDLEAKDEEDNSTYAIIINTGFNSQQGEVAKLAAISQFPPYSVDLYKILLFMSVLVVPYMAVTIYISNQMIQSLLTKLAFWNIMFQCVYSVSIILIQPILLSIVNNGLAKKEKVQTSNINHILKCKRVSFICFDKTGTLTENEQKLHCIAVASGNQQQMLKAAPSEADKAYQEFLEANPLVSLLMGTCHSLTEVKGFMVGDSIETGMFYASGWKLIEKDTYGVPEMEELQTKIIRVFPFTPESQTMSVVVSNPKFGAYGLVKGSPEKIRTLVRRQELGFQAESELFNYFTNGFRVIAMAGKPLEGDEPLRSELEKELIFFGFLIFENPLKPETIPTLEILHKSNIRECMITGDNVLTGLECASRAGIVDEGFSVFMVEWNEDRQSLEFSEHKPLVEDLKTNKEKKPPSNHGPGENLIEMQEKREMTQHLLSDKDKELSSSFFDVSVIRRDNVQFALSGRTFDAISSYIEGHPEETGVYLEFLRKCRVFGRAKPTQKSSIVKQIKRIYEPNDIYVGYVGDGINDCGAYQAADTSVSLGTGSMALISNFSTENQNISYVFPIMREGRAAGFMLLALVTFSLLMNVIFGTYFLMELLLGVAAEGFWPLVIGSWPLYQVVSFFYIKSEQEIIEVLPPRYLVNARWIVFFFGYLLTYIAFDVNPILSFLI